MKNDRRVPFDWWIIAFFHVQCHQPWNFWNLMFWVLVEYWGNLPFVGSWMGKSLHMFYWYLFFWGEVFSVLLKIQDAYTCSSRSKEVDCRWLFNCLILIILLYNWSVERCQQLVWLYSNLHSCYRNWLWGRRRLWFHTQCIGEQE